MLYNPKTKCFILTKETLPDFFKRERALVVQDLESRLVKASEVINHVHKNDFQYIFQELQSISFRTILIAYIGGHSLNVLSALGLNTAQLKESYINALDYEDTVAISINENGGCSHLKEIDKDAVEYSFGLKNLTNNDSQNLIIENGSKLSTELLEKINPNTKPSVLLQYKHIATDANINNFILSRNDWILWIETQGMELELYEMFLTNYQNHIQEIFVSTSNKNILSTLAAKFPKINIQEF